MGRRLPVALLLLLVACGWRGPTPIQTWSHLEPVPNVVMLDEAAWELVSLSDIQVSRHDDGRLDVVLELANLSSLPVEVQAQTVFRDAQGALIDDETNWSMLVLPGNGSVRYQVKSLSTAAASFTVQVKTP